MTAETDTKTDTITKVIKFSYNWNNKLNCNFFTTIRKLNKYYQLGEIYKVFCNEIFCFDAKIIHISRIYMRDLTEKICLHDTGYPMKETKIMLKKMHHLEDYQVEDFEIIVIYFLRCNAIKNLPVITEFKSS